MAKVILMADTKLFRLSGSDADRIDEVVNRVKEQAESMGFKKVKPTTILRALIFYSQRISDDDLIEAIKQANIYA